MVGHWKSAVSDKNWECFRHRLSDIELDCSGNRLTFIGSLVFWETTGDYGIYDGLDTIHWKSGKWIRRGLIHFEFPLDTFKFIGQISNFNMITYLLHDFRLYI